MTVVDDAKRYYDAYWGSHQRRYEPEPELWHLILDGVEGDRCLDVGCGIGNSYAPVVAARASVYAGVDVSPVAVSSARAAGLDARVIEDAGELPFEDASFDRAICVEVLEHLFEPDRAVAEIQRVLRPGGRLVASVPNVAYWRMRANLVFGVWNPLGDEQAVVRPWRDPHLRFFTMTTLDRMLREAGFGSVSVGAHGGRWLGHVIPWPTSLGRGRLYPRAERHAPALLGLVLHAVAIK